MQTNIEKADIAIITIIPEEFNAMRSQLTNPQFIQFSSDKPNLYAWEFGTILSEITKSPYNIVLALAGRSGNISASQVVAETIRVFEPRYVILVGIAGGFHKDNLKKGDVVVSKTIYSYEYGKVAEEFKPRHDFTYPVDTALLNSALRIGTTTNSWKLGLPEPPISVVNPKVLDGTIASGDKVVDDVTNEFFAKVLESWPGLIAVEMEGAGAGAAIEEAHAKGIAVGFLMIRGISDMPSGQEPANITETSKFTSQTEERDAWKVYASSTAAWFTKYLIANGWPVTPKKNNSKEQQNNIQRQIVDLAIKDALAKFIIPFRQSRIDKIIKGETPLKFEYSPIALLHLFPLERCEQYNLQYFLPPGIEEKIKLCLPQPEQNSYTSWYWRHSFNSDGFVIYKAINNKQVGDDYLQIFNNGILEYVDFGIQSRVDDIRGIDIRDIEGKFIAYDSDLINKYLMILKLLGLKPPIIFILSLLNVKNYPIIYRVATWGNYHNKKTENVIDKDQLDCPIIVFDSYDENIGKELQKVFDFIWRAVGFSKSFHFDNEGIWKGCSLSNLD